MENEIGVEIKSQRTPAGVKIEQPLKSNYRFFEVLNCRIFGIQDEVKIGCFMAI